VIEIELSKKGPKRGKYRAIVSDEDADLRYLNWAVTTKETDNTQYARKSNGPGRQIYLHAVVAERSYGPRPKGSTIDHINRNGLDNRRENLRYVSLAINRINSKLARNNLSGIPGVYYDEKSPRLKNRWRAFFSINGKKTTLGHFKEKEEAVNARLEAERNYYGTK